MIVADDDKFMRLAINVAQDAIQTPGASPIACVIVRYGQVLSIAHNEVDLRNDPTAHAEMLAIRRACRETGEVELREATLYSTLQPCGMCTMASIWAKLGRIVYGAGKGDVHRMYFEDRQLECGDFVRDAFREDLSVCGGVLVEACAALYRSPDEPIPPSDQVNL